MLFCDALWKQMAIIALKAQPAHDARHAMYKVPAAALAYIHSERVEGWERVGVLEPFDMPTRVKQHILLSALRRTAGADATDPMALKITVSADRDQLYGPEFALRIVHHILKYEEFVIV